MFRKDDLRAKAIAMRLKGVTYNGIMDQVPVAKSTLNLWFREVKLSRRQQQKITIKRKEAQMKGALAKHKKRVAGTAKIIRDAEKEVGEITPRELWLIGVTLYWAEGTKEKDWKPGTRVCFTNMDSNMVRTFIAWLNLCGITNDELAFEIFLHKNHKKRTKEVMEYWAGITRMPLSKFGKMYYKSNQVNTKRRNVSGAYFGTLKIYVRQSSSFLRKITGWINGVQNAINKA